MHVVQQPPSSPHNELAEILGSGEGDLDAIARAIAAACLRDPELEGKIARFKPWGSFVPNAELNFEESTVNSDITDPTFISVDTGNVVGEAALQHPQPNEASRMYSKVED